MGQDTAGDGASGFGKALGAIGAAAGPIGAVVAAQLEADKAMEEAGRILEEQYMSGVSIPMEAYDLEREGIAQAGAQAIQAVSEGEARGASAGVGRVVALQQDALAKQRSGLAERQFQLEKDKASELSKLQQGRLDIQLGKATGYQQMLADQRAAQSASTLAGVQGISSAASDIFEFLTPLYGNQGKPKDKDKTDTENS